MSAKTRNIYGKISISNDTIKKFIGNIIPDCYGVVSFCANDLLEHILSAIFKEKFTKGVHVRTTGDRISISVCVIIKYGINIKAVVEALKQQIKYRVENFTGMIVDVIDIRVAGVKA